MTNSKRYLCISRLRAESPFMIGNGEDTYSDKDLLVDHKGEVFIPGTSLAGVCRAYLESKWSQDKVDKIFGSGKVGKISSLDKQSKVIFFDSFLIRDSKRRIRDSVSLTNKVAEANHKFDFEIVEAGAEFAFRIEFRIVDDTDEENLVNDCIQTLVNGFNQGEIRIGGKTNRGYGYFKLMVSDKKEGLQSRKFNLKKIEATKPKKNKSKKKQGKKSSSTTPEVTELKDYISVHSQWADLELWKNTTKLEKLTQGWKLFGPQSNPNISFYSHPLQLKSFLFIRDYGIQQSKGEAEITAGPLKNGLGQVVIPGTSWAGVFRQQMKRILDSPDINGVARIFPEFYINGSGFDSDGFIRQLFGFVDKERKEAQASQIAFRESVFNEEEIAEIIRTRTAVDRFTGGASNGLLFSNMLAYRKGTKTTCQLEIQLANPLIFNGEAVDSNQKKFISSLLESCIQDLEEGYLAIGGQTAVGGGVFEKRR